MSQGGRGGVMKGGKGLIIKEGENGSREGEKGPWREKDRLSKVQ